MEELNLTGALRQAGARSERGETVVYSPPCMYAFNIRPGAPLY